MPNIFYYAFSHLHPRQNPLVYNHTGFVAPETILGDLRTQQHLLHQHASDRLKVVHRRTFRAPWSNFIRIRILCLCQFWRECLHGTPSQGKNHSRSNEALSSHLYKLQPLHLLESTSPKGQEKSGALSKSCLLEAPLSARRKTRIESTPRGMNHVAHSRISLFVLES